MKDESLIKNRLIEFYEESKENINFKSQLIISLIQSIKEENNQFFSRSKFKQYKKLFFYPVFSLFDTKRITVNTKQDLYNVPLLDDKLNENNTIFQASLINLSNLIQKILEENKKNQEKNMSDFSSSNSIILKDYSIQNKTNKNKEANKKIVDLKRNYSDRLKNATPNKTITDRNFASNIHINTLATIKGLMTNNNFHNYVGNAIEKSSSTQDEKNSKSIIDQSELIEDTNKIKEKKKNNNKTLSSFDHRKNIYNIFDNKREKDKLLTKNNKGGSALNKLKSNKRPKDKERIISRKEIITTPDLSKIKEEKISKSNKLLKTVSHNNNTIYRKSYQHLNINTNTNIISKNKNTSKNNLKKSLTHYGTKSDLAVNKIQNNNVTNTTSAKINNKEELLKKLSIREKSYYALSNSPILRLKERLLFGRSTQNLRNIQPVSDILKTNETFLNDKIKELEEKMAECDKRINKTFTASKTAEINFNFILSKDEEEFKSFVWLAENEREKSEYYTYLKIIYLVFNENYENIELKHLSEKLYGLVNKKGYKTLKEYLYYLYFKKKDNTIIYNIDKINDLLNEKQIDDNFNVKFCRFALFTSFLIKEVIKYGNETKNMMELKIKTKELIDVISNKLKLYKAENNSKKN